MLEEGEFGPGKVIESRVLRLVVSRKRSELIDMVDEATRELAIAVRATQNMIRAARERVGLPNL